MAMIILITFFSIASLSIAQRPTYAGTLPKGYPELASRFKGTSAEENSSSSTGSGVENRFGENDKSTPKIPIDARGDVNLVERINQWPRENRPFWLLNSDHIEKHRDTKIRTPVQNATRNQ